MTSVNLGKQCNFFESYANDFIFEMPAYFVFKGKRYEALYWIDLIDQLCNLLAKKDKAKMEEFLAEEKQRKRRIAYLAEKKEDIHFKKHLPRSGLWANQKIDAPRSVKLLRLLLAKYEIDESAFSLCMQINEEEKDAA